MRLILIPIEEVFGGSEGVNAETAVRFGHTGVIRGSEVAGRQGVPMHTETTLATNRGLTGGGRTAWMKTYVGPGRKGTERSTMKSSFSELRREPGRE